MSRRIVEIKGKRLSLSNLEKDLYPSYGFTKAHILDYYRRISKFILPHLKDRALTLKRYPEGVNEEYFFEKRCPSHKPEWVKTAILRLEEGEKMTACLVNNLETLIWVANLASLELHVPLARVDSPDVPDSMVFDLDPGDKANILHCASVSLILRDILQKLRLKSYIKTSGKKGLHVYVPLNSKGITFKDTKKFSKAVAGMMQKEYPDLVTSKMAKEYRKGKVFINWAQNDSKKTMICVYSLRAVKKPTVSFPLSWKELERLAKRGDPEKFHIIYSEAIKRVKKNGDLFKDMLTKKQRLPHL